LPKRPRQRYLEGREYVVPEDVKEVAVAVCSHRLICRAEQESINKEELLSAILGSIPGAAGLTITKARAPSTLP